MGNSYYRLFISICEILVDKWSPQYEVKPLSLFCNAIDVMTSKLLIRPMTTRTQSSNHQI